MSLGKMCHCEAITISHNQTLKDAVNLMKENNVGSIVVVKGKEPCGFITDRDILLDGVASGKNLDATKVSEIMSKDLLTLKQDQDIQEAIKAMQDKGVRRAPVIDNEGNVAGIAAVDDLLVLIADELKCVASIIQSQAPQTLQ